MFPYFKINVLLQKGIIALGRDDGMLEIHNLEKKEQILEHQGHEKRVKCLQFFKLSDEELYLVSADSQGVIRLLRWKVSQEVASLVLKKTFLPLRVSGF